MPPCLCKNEGGTMVKLKQEVVFQLLSVLILLPVTSFRAVWNHSKRILHLL